MCRFSVAIPRIRDFRGMSPRAFDGRGNFNIGVKEQIIFPEIEYDKIDALRGAPGKACRLELARSPVFGECLAGFECADEADRNWLARPRLTAVLTVDAAGQVASVMIVTVAPSPARVQRSGIYPGLSNGTVHELPHASTGTHN